ncbi:MAG: DUF5706 domain-containing protein [Bacteroidales bacterium]
MEQTDEKIENPKTKKTGKGNARDTLYRTTLQNQMRSIAIVDQKANIIIGINTVLISIIMATTGMETNFEKFNLSDNIGLSVPFTIMLIFCAASGILSILVVRPTANLWLKENASRLFFRNLKKINLDQFNFEMNEIAQTNERIYEVLNVDIYLQACIIHRKYRLVRHAYTVFMSGLILSVLAFILLHL